MHICVARELHRDGSDHYHAIISLPDHIDIRDPTYFDLEGHHGNYQGVRNYTNVLNYVRKAGEFLESGQTPYASKSQDSDILSAEDPIGALTDAIQSSSIRLRGYKRLREDLLTALSDITHRRRFPYIERRFNSCTIGQCLTFTFSSRFKSPKLYIWGPPNTGKTSLLDQYNPAYLYHAPDNNDWTGLNCNYHKMIIFDEFHGQHPLSTLLKMMQGSHTRINTKGGSYDYNVNMPIIFLSNVAPTSCYKHPEAFLARLKVFKFISFQTIDYSLIND